MDILAIIVSLIGVGVAAAQLWTTFPKRQLAYDVTAVPLMTESATNVDKLEVMYDLKPVAQPYLATFTLASIGRSDIPEESFSGGKPLLFDFGVPVIAAVGTPATEPRQEAEVRIRDESFLAVDPVLLPKTLFLRITFLTDGAPQPHAAHRLTDVPVLSANDLREKYFPLRSKSKRTFKWVAYLSLGAFFAAAIGVQMVPSLGSLNTPGSGADYIARQAGLIALLVTALVGAGVWVLNAAISWRLRPLAVLDRQPQGRAMAGSAVRQGQADT
ncbi:hypothetical protein J2Y66_003459 [Paenarthrobacter nitroguajacolicus]|uniref:hypothetical protein n=1 Tax=Paenarthrobacter nitroguajacolicus TaxID=211146 RepID=UPI0028654F89|nr:hypothetical protein [Paenarthrobacter nitroguajacolicus]MDR6988951.1 hypothetical protein [Paenarthrobacter nitroguajacolicus]